MLVTAINKNETKIRTVREECWCLTQRKNELSGGDGRLPAREVCKRELRPPPGEELQLWGKVGGEIGGYRRALPGSQEKMWGPGVNVFFSHVSAHGGGQKPGEQPARIRGSPALPGLAPLGPG